METMIASARDLLVPLLVVLAGIGIFWSIRRYFRAHKNNFAQTLLLWLIGSILVILFVVVIPVGDEVKRQILTVMGLLLTLLLAFASSSFVANAMAGLMLRGIDNFSVGDFLHVESYFGRVTERGFFHTEIQTENRDLTTIPNLYLVSNPVTVVRESGTMISAEVSLGYDNSVEQIEKILVAAAERVELREPFVYVRELGDFSVVYRVAGFLEDVRQMLTFRSRLRKAMIEGLHAADIEIVSPAFMNQRQIVAGEKVRSAPSLTAAQSASPGVEKLPESIVFDKADTAEKKAILELRQKHLRRELEKLKEAAKKDNAATDIEALQTVLAQRLAVVERMLESVDEDLKN